MKVLISPQSLEEARECFQGGADIIDVKNPSEGSLGANFPWVIRSIRKAIPIYIPISATVGDVPNKPGTVSLAALGAAFAGASFVKIGLAGASTESEGIAIMKAVKRTIDEYQLPTLVVAAGYAEGEAIGSLSHSLIPKIAQKARCDFAMIDTFDKKIKQSIFDILTIEDLKVFINQCHKKQVQTALGGAIQKKHIGLLKDLRPEVVGVRGAVCHQGDRLNGKIKAGLVQDFISALKN
ncbi:MAG: hypothetical protein GF308_04795 [Candidatus Heimdallarchaeota archaeon]|nr:hypothetical protein [Candidatus Heimdallarchaeota archaeon]